MCGLSATLQNPFKVGYAQKDTASSGFAMLSAQFESVGANDGSATLADLTIGGYEKYDEKTDEGGTSGEFGLQVLTSSGTTEASYSWYDDDVKTGWFNDTTGESADSVSLEAGKGVWVSGHGLSMTSAGAVSESDVIITTAASGFKAIANTTPVALTLSKLAITGYDPYDEKTDEGGTSGVFNIQFLTATGTTSASYSWYDDDEKTGWFNDNTGDLANNVEIPAGAGVWVSGHGLTIRIPAPEL